MGSVSPWYNAVAILTVSIHTQVHQGSGVQAILCEGVQGVVNIEVRGPRLNETKVERASVVYGKDHRLHWRVTPPMPKIMVSVAITSGCTLGNHFVCCIKNFQVHCACTCTLQICY